MYNEDIYAVMPYDGVVSEDTHYVNIIFNKPVEILEIKYFMQGTVVEEDLMEFTDEIEEMLWKHNPGEIGFQYVDESGGIRNQYELQWYILNYRHTFTTTSMDEVHVRYMVDDEGEIVERLYTFDLKLEG